jgi:hypothetical protein
MTANLYQEWIQQWDHELEAKEHKILLLQKNFSGHIIPDSLWNIHVENFEPNLTAHVQPCSLLISLGMRWTPQPSDTAGIKQVSCLPYIILVRMMMSRMTHCLNPVQHIMRCFRQHLLSTGVLNMLMIHLHVGSRQFWPHLGTKYMYAWTGLSQALGRPSQAMAILVWNGEHVSFVISLAISLAIPTQPLLNILEMKSSSVTGA